MRFISIAISILMTTQLAIADDVIKDTVNSPEGALQIFLSLAFVIFILLAVSWLLKRMNLTGNHISSIMKVKGSLYISPKERLVIVDIAGEDVVVGVAPGFITHIKTLSSPIDESHSSPNVSSIFQKKLNILLKKNNSHDKDSE